MLSPSIRSLVKATVPVLKEHGVALTRHFYARMFAHNPELKPLFNQGSQQNGSQQTALAMAVLAYAEHIDNPGVLASVLTLVANKHVSLGIRSEHYAIVGKHLLASIQEVMGAAATEELVAAWAAAYGQLADLLIGMERALYQKSASEEGAWTGWRSFRIVKKERESEEITSFYLSPADGGQVPSFKPGQYLSVRVHVPSLGMAQPRQYSLSQAPGQTHLRISVKRESAGVDKPEGMVSATLHDHMNEGMFIDAATPMGDYVLHEDRDTPVVLISAGVGITPKISMLEHLLANNSTRQIHFVHACRHGGVHAFKQRVRDLSRRHKNLNTVTYYETPRTADVAQQDYQHAGRLHLAAIADQVVPADADFYVCGPKPFMQVQVAELSTLGVDPSRIHVEAFGSGGLST